MVSFYGALFWNPACPYSSLIARDQVFITTLTCTQYALCDSASTLFVTWTKSTNAFVGDMFGYVIQTTTRYSRRVWALPVPISFHYLSTLRAWSRQQKLKSGPVRCSSCKPVVCNTSWVFAVVSLESIWNIFLGAGVAQSVQCLATGWTSGGSIPGRGEMTFPLAFVSKPSLLYDDTCAPFPGANAGPGRDADHSSPPSAKVKNERSYTSSPPSAFMACSETALVFLF
jgi:hypothetical protein